MRKLIVAFIVCSGLLFGQQRDTVYRQLITTSTSSSTVVATIPASASIGQVSHLFTITFFDATGQTCDDVNNGSFPLTTQVQGSFDNDGWFSIPAKVQGTAELFSGTATERFVRHVSGYGAFPYIRLRITSWNNTACRMTVFYAGTTNATPDFNDGLTPETFGNTNLYTLSTDPIVINGTDTTQTITRNNANERLVLYGLVLWAVGATNHVAIECYDGSSSFARIRLDSFTGNTGMVLPTTGNAYFGCFPKQDIRITVGANTMDLFGSIIYRRE